MAHSAFIQPVTLPLRSSLATPTSLSERCSRVRPSFDVAVAPSAMAARPRPKGNSSSKKRFDPTRPPPTPQKTKLEPEEVFYDGRTSWTELIIPTISVLTVIGIIPFIAAAARYAWVRYRITSRRISVDSGFQGKDHIEVVYRDIASIKYVRRMAGASADCVLELKDGAKLEIRAIPDFDKTYDYILSKVDDEAKAASGSVS
jgi:Bacterial PH domain